MITASAPLTRALAAIALAAVALFAPAARADIHNGYAVHLLVNGNPVDQTAGLSNDGSGVTRTYALGSASADVAINANQFTAAKVALTGTGNGYGKVKASTSYTFKLKAPAGAASVKGGKLVLRAALEATAAGDADVHVVVAVSSDMGKATGSAIISDAATGREEFDVVVPIAAFVENIETINAEVHQQVDVTARIAGGASASAEAKNGTRVIGFRVLDGSGKQIPGFAMNAAGGNIPESAVAGPTPPPVASSTTAIEFFNAAFKHYFVSANPGEIAKLDDGTFAGWTRTGQSFRVSATAAAGTVPVCRLFTVAFPPTSSHFYAPRGLGCEGALTNPQWQYEGEVFHVVLPGAGGACPNGSLAVYRLYNNGRGGAPNHRFTTSEAIRQQMLAEGFVAEGAGPGIGFCSPQ